jgi:hypothetical protein
MSTKANSTDADMADYPSEWSPSEKGTIDPEHGSGVDYAESPVEENYRTLGRWRACVLLITIEVGIGILSLPSALKTLGLIPGIIAIIGFGSLTTYCGYILVQFYRRYPTITNLVDCAYHVGGTPFEIFLGIAFVFNLVLICSSANITLYVMPSISVRGSPPASTDANL